jgi:excisionase family DNA binding protein
MSEDVWLTVQEAAKYLKVTRQTLYVYMAEGLLPFWELKGKRGRRLRREDLDSLFERRVGGSVGSAGGSTDS